MAGVLYLMAFERLPKLGPAEYDPLNKHVTILPLFALSQQKLITFQRTMHMIMPWFEPFDVIVDHHETFGTPEKQMPVAIVTPSNDSLIQLHETCMNVVKDLNGVINTPEFCGANYRPHVTKWMDSIGSRMHMEHMTLVEHKGGFGIDVVNLANYHFGK